MSNEQHYLDGPLVTMCVGNGKLYVATKHSVYALETDSWSGQTKATKIFSTAEEEKNGSQA